MNDIISIAEIEAARSPVDFITWFESFLEKTKDGQYEEQILLRNGIADFIYGEVFPLYRFLQVFGDEWPNVKFYNKKGSQQFDVVVQPEGDAPFNHIEITNADMRYEENLRMRVFLQDRSVSALGDVSYTGNERSGLKIDVADVAVSHEKLNSDVLSKLETSIQKKSKKLYPASTALLLYFDDYAAFSQATDDNKMVEFLNNIDSFWENKFTHIYAIGASGKKGWVKPKGEPAVRAYRFAQPHP